MYYIGMGLCSGHGNSVVIRELSLCPQSLLAKLTVLDSPGVQNDAGSVVDIHCWFAVVSVNRSTFTISCLIPFMVRTTWTTTP